MLKVTDLTVERGDRIILNKISCEVNAGEVLQVVGKNGSGKSTLAHALAGDIRILSGSITAQGKLGYLLQNIEIDFPITVGEFIQMADPKTDIHNVVSLLHLEELLNEKVTQISMGQLQRVELAQVLLLDPEIYLLDEPFSAQDQANTQLIIAVLAQLKARNKTIIVINHLAINLDELVDRTLTLI